MGLVDLKCKQETLKISTIFRLEDDACIANCAYQSLDPVLRQMIWKCNLKPKDCIQKFGLESSWAQVLHAWCLVNYCQPQSKSQVLDQLIWMNSNIKVNGELIRWQAWIMKNLWTISDIVHQNGALKNHFELGVDWLMLCMLWDAIPSAWKALLREEVMGEPTRLLYNELVNVAPQTRNRKIYGQLIDSDTDWLKYYHRWVERGLEMDTELYRSAFQQLYPATEVTKFRDFQYRLILGKIVTNSDLLSWGITEHSNCTLCENGNETLILSFWECEEIQGLIDYFYRVCTNNQLNITRDLHSWILNVFTLPKTHIVRFIAIFISLKSHSTVLSFSCHL